MSEVYRTTWRAIFGLLLLCATPALANHVDTANVTFTCSSYSLSIRASALDPGKTYQINYTIDSLPSSGGFPITGFVPFTAVSSTYETTVWGSFPPLNGSFSFSGQASLAGWNTIPIDTSPTTLTCGATPPPPVCSSISGNASNFNGTSLDSGQWIWFNANFTAKGIPSTGAVITFSNSKILNTGDGTAITNSAPNARITFSPTAACTTTTFNTMTNTWFTIVPMRADDEIFLTGVAVPVPAGGLPGGVNVNWTGTFDTGGVAGISIDWKWGAAVYSSLGDDFNTLAIKPGHQTACRVSNGDHAGTPEGANDLNQLWKQFVISGATGGGGSNWTGSWSGTLSAFPQCGQSTVPVGPKG
ncbi:MAG TPA: hypothetical protein VK684_10710 [Edaphobacter sp.]|nr:hypothetical protein [Edaphobacter sp.]